MEIVYSVCADLSEGGIGKVATHAINGIKSSGYLKRLFDMDTLTNGTSKFLWGLKKIFPEFNGMYNYNLVFDTLVYLKQPNCDIFHGWNGQCLRSISKAKRNGTITFVERASSHPLYQQRILFEEYNKWNIKQNPVSLINRSCKELEVTDYVTIPSDFVEQSFLEYKYPEEKLIKIPFGADCSQYPKQKPHETSKFIFLFMGSVGIRKGIPYLIQAWNKLNLRNAELRIRGRIEPEIKTLLLQNDSIKMLDYNPDIKKEFMDANVFVFPSIEEGSALVTYEAMAASLPQITTYNSGTIARDGLDGFVLNIRDIEALSDSIQYFYDNPNEAERMGRNARNHVEKYTWERYSNSLVKAYESI